MHGSTTWPWRKQASIVSTHSGRLPRSVSTTSPAAHAARVELGGERPRGGGDLAHRPLPPRAVAGRARRARGGPAAAASTTSRAKFTAAKSLVMRWGWSAGPIHNAVTRRTMQADPSAAATAAPRPHTSASIVASRNRPLGRRRRRRPGDLRLVGRRRRATRRPRRCRARASPLTLPPALTTRGPLPVAIGQGGDGRGGEGQRPAATCSSRSSSRRPRRCPRPRGRPAAVAASVRTAAARAATGAPASAASSAARTSTGGNQRAESPVRPADQPATAAAAREQRQPEAPPAEARGAGEAHAARARRSGWTSRCRPARRRSRQRRRPPRPLRPRGPRGRPGRRRPPSRCRRARPRSRRPRRRAVPAAAPAPAPAAPPATACAPAGNGNGKAKGRC